MSGLIPIHSPLFLGGVPDDPPDWRSIFGCDGPFALDIGCGIGDFTVSMAEKFPLTCFIAIDYYNRGCLKTCSRAERHGTANIRVVRGEVREFITRCIPHGFLSRVYINCPDPWPKQRHRKRRLVNAAFLGWLREFLADGAEVVFATDFNDYGNDVAKLFPGVPGYRNLLEPDLYRHALEDYPVSKYMRKFMTEGKRIFFVRYITV